MNDEEINELIARDETMHMRFACLLYSELKSPMAPVDIVAMVAEAVVLEKAFFTGGCSSVPSIQY